MNRQPKIPYGIKDFKRIRDEGYYYVDKTAYIRRMEERDSFVFFVRPRRMGKECVFNSDMALFYLKSLVAKGQPPENMLDANIRTDYEKLKIIAEIQRQHGRRAGTGSCAVQNSDGQDGAFATAAAFPGAGQGASAPASQATASASAADASTAAGQGHGGAHNPATAPAAASASTAAAQATASASAQAFPSEFCTASTPTSPAAGQATASATAQALPSEFCTASTPASPAAGQATASAAAHSFTQPLNRHALTHLRTHALNYLTT